MSVKQLEQIKQQITTLSAEEKADLQRFLATLPAQSSPSSEPASATTSEDRIEKRRRLQTWLTEHRAQYGGLYVALDGDRLLGTGKNYPEAYAAAQRAGVADAYIDFVPPLGYIGELSGWV
jgi:hypothetical protein